MPHLVSATLPPTHMPCPRLLCFIVACLLGLCRTRPASLRHRPPASSFTVCQHGRAQNRVAISPWLRWPVVRLSARPPPPLAPRPGSTKRPMHGPLNRSRPARSAIRCWGEALRVCHYDGRGRRQRLLDCRVGRDVSRDSPFALATPQCLPV